MRSQWSRHYGMRFHEYPPPPEPSSSTFESTKNGPFVWSVGYCNDLSKLVSKAPATVVVLSGFARMWEKFIACPRLWTFTFFSFIHPCVSFLLLLFFRLVLFGCQDRAGSEDGIDSVLGGARHDGRYHDCFHTPQADDPQIHRRWEFNWHAAEMGGMHQRKLWFAQQSRQFTCWTVQGYPGMTMQDAACAYKGHGFCPRVGPQILKNSVICSDVQMKWNIEAVCVQEP